MRMKINENSLSPRGQVILLYFNFQRCPPPHYIYILIMTCPHKSFSFFFVAVPEGYSTIFLTVSWEFIFKAEETLSGRQNECRTVTIIRSNNTLHYYNYYGRWCILGSATPSCTFSVSVFLYCGIYFVMNTLRSIGLWVHDVQSEHTK